MKLIQSINFIYFFACDRGFVLRSRDCCKDASLFFSFTSEFWSILNFEFCFNLKLNLLSLITKLLLNAFHRNLQWILQMLKLFLHTLNDQPWNQGPEVVLIPNLLSFVLKKTVEKKRKRWKREEGEERAWERISFLFSVNLICFPLFSWFR